ncbi:MULTISPECIES: hypothetical protein [Flavobacterium]|uniref:hypothetical protein n=1 Tax=Flavobacterium TaxID=237 RepID=UPI0011842BAD|nr:MULTISPECIES: hypothetical protein [Flavobacterium]MCR4032143.1 hypothetical protein [Flavobacterium panacis]
MSFYNHTLDWITGELFEAYFISNFGIIILASGLLFAKFGQTPNSKALLIPLILVGCVYAAIGLSMIITNNKRLDSYPEDFEKDSRSFVHTEKKRVEDFQVGYTISKITATVLFPLTVFLLWYSKNPNVQAAGIGLALFALAGLAVDYFSQERADRYYQKILMEPKTYR